VTVNVADPPVEAVCDAGCAVITGALGAVDTVGVPLRRVFGLPVFVT
jgi:hypothetical protein